MQIKHFSNFYVAHFKMATFVKWLTKPSARPRPKQLDCPMIYYFNRYFFFFFIHLAIAHLTQMKLNGMIISNNNFIVGLAHVFVWFFKRKCIYSQRMAFNPTILTCNVIRVNP